MGQCKHCGSLLITDGDCCQNCYFRVAESNSKLRDSMENSRKFYAIRHKLTGKFLPVRSNNWNCSATKVEFPKNDTYVPRLFLRRSDAECALRWWLEGITYWRNGYACDDCDGPSEYTKKVKERKSDDVEIVVVHVIQRIQ